MFSIRLTLVAIIALAICSEAVACGKIAARLRERIQQRRQATQGAQSMQGIQGAGACAPQQSFAPSQSYYGGVIYPTLSGEEIVVLSGSAADPWKCVGPNCPLPSFSVNKPAPTTRPRFAGFTP